MLTGKQQKIFQPIKIAAWQAYCRRAPGENVLDRAAMDRWYRKALVTGLGIFSTKQIAAKDGGAFDRLCLHFSTLAGDQKQIDYWSRAEERRALWRLKMTMRNAGVDWAYVRGIARNMGFGAREIEDLPAELILKLNTAVFLYIRRRGRSDNAKTTWRGSNEIGSDYDWKTHG
jgi:hypothetical protein